MTSPNPSRPRDASRRPVPPLDPPQQFAGGDVVGAVRLPVDVRTLSRRHVIMVRYERAGRQYFGTHVVAHDHVTWVSLGNGHYDLSWSQAVRDMAVRAELES